MTTIAATCDECGNVRLETSDVQLWVSADSEHGHYTFTCPDCGARCSYPASAETQSKLRNAEVATFTYPDELADEKRGPAGGDVINDKDDLLDLHLALEAHDRGEAVWG